MLCSDAYVQSEGNTTALIPERVASNTVLSEGDRVRVSVESPESGYLYVIDRELYSAGEHGNPFLIFPTTRALGGNNKVSGGELIDIPGQDDSPNFFTIKRSRSDHAGEELTLLLTMQPLTVTAGAGAQELSPEVVAVWEKQGMGSKVTAFELSGGAGKAWTESEQRAGQDGTRLLTQEDPPPQTVYRVESRAGAPLLVRVRLRCSTR